MKHIFSAALLICAALFACAQVTDPLITSWKLNLTGHTVTDGSTTILTDVEEVHYDNNFVYVHTSGVPSYYTFGVSVNDASDANFTWKFTRAPQANTGTPTSALGGGQYGAFVDGDPIFNAEDAQTYNNGGIWHRIAYYFEYNDFDWTWGHSTPNKVYHHHVLNLAMCDSGASNLHSPIVGWMFDGYPVYGPFGYTDPADTVLGISRMRSSYAYRNITTRTTLPDGTVLQPSQYGPNVNNQYKLGCFREDYIYTAGSGDLDDHNGRWCITPEYPGGTYAYFCTLDTANNARYPYTVGQSLYGVMTTGNTGPNGGHNTVPGNATLYTPQITGIEETAAFETKLYPNPVNSQLTVKIKDQGEYTFNVIDVNGKVVSSNLITTSPQQIDLQNLSAGSYVISIVDNASGATSVSRLVKF